MLCPQQCKHAYSPSFVVSFFEYHLTRATITKSEAAQGMLQCKKYGSSMSPRKVL